MKTIPCYWWQNIQQPQIEPLNLTATYDPLLYPTFDNYEAINVCRVKDIPKDYFGVMGVPVRFMRYFNTDDWEIFGTTRRHSPYITKVYSAADSPKWNDLNADPVLRTEDGLKMCYTRLLVQHKH